ncbi:MAG: histidine kinase [Steroidobacteraceae bacterium]
MSATPLEPVAPALLAVARAGDRTALRPLATARSSFWPSLAVLTVFWIYVALSNILYATTMGQSLRTLNVTHFFAPWDARLLQHVLLYPVLVLCVWASLRLGWQPLRFRLPVQLLLAAGFALLASPMLAVTETVMGEWHGDTHAMHKDWGSWSDFVSGPALSTWAASATSTLVTYGFGLALISGFAFYQRLRDAQLREAALERALTSAHLAALRMQLSPHTLFNLLHAIRGQISWDPPAAQAMVVQLGDLLRRLLSAGERDFSRLSDELQFVLLYLELQQRRFSDRLTIAVPTPASALRVWVPSLILQPLVENAVVHGLAGHDGPVSVSITAEAAGETLVLRVENSIAAGRDTGHGAGIGLANVRERLAVQFGERATFSAGPQAGGVWLAEIRMPLLRDGPEGVAQSAAARRS